MKPNRLAQVDFPALEEKVREQYPKLKFGFASKIGTILTNLLPYVYVLAGLVLFIYLIIGGFGLLTSAGNPKAVESAKGKITNAIIGFLIIFISYWIIQILEIVFGIEILGI